MKWHASSLRGCVGYKKGQSEWAIVDDDGGICLCTCHNKEFANKICESLNETESQYKKNPNYPQYTKGPPPSYIS